MGLQNHWSSGLINLRIIINHKYGIVTDIFGCIRKDTCLHTFRYHLLRVDTDRQLQIRICYAVLRIKRCNMK